MLGLLPPRRSVLGCAVQAVEGGDARESTILTYQGRELMENKAGEIPSSFIISDSEDRTGTEERKSWDLIP